MSGIGVLAARARDYLRSSRPVEYATDELKKRYRKARREEVIDNYAEDVKYLNVGGGDFIRDHWRVLDYYSQWYDYDELFIDYPIDLEERGTWPIEDDSFDLCFSSHTLEHLSDAAVRNTLRESNRILKPGRPIRLNIPDVDIARRQYENGNAEWFMQYRGARPPDELFSIEYHMEEYLLGFFASHLTMARGGGEAHCVDFEQVRADVNSMEEAAFYQKYSNMIADEWQQQKPGFHRNWFNFDRLEALLDEAGFEDVTQQRCQVSDHLEFVHSQFNKRPHMSVFVEAVASE